MRLIIKKKFKLEQSDEKLKINLAFFPLQSQTKGPYISIFELFFHFYVQVRAPGS